MRLNKAGFSIVFHVHDEAVLEVPEGKSSVEEVCRIMAEPPSWVHGLPLRADGYECQFYKRIRRNCRMKHVYFNRKFPNGKEVEWTGDGV